MSAVDWDALARACAEFSPLDGAEREAALQRLERTEPALAAELRSLLEAEHPLSAEPAPWDRPSSLAAGAAAAAPTAPPAPAPLPQVRRIGRYHVEAVLGTGGSATVYRARTLIPPRAVAIKLFHVPLTTGDTADERAASRRFDAEVRALSRLRHHGIATILDAGSSTIESVERRWIAMELVEGGPITRWAATADVPQRERVRLAADLAAAVAHAHARGIIHRDLKPANVLVELHDGAPVVRVLDFGVARLLEDDDALTRLTIGGQLIGTVGYLAPEQVSGDVDAISTSVDVYAMGLILHELLSGAPAVEVPTGSLVARLQAVARACPRPIRSAVPGIPEDLAVVVDTATARDPAERYVSAAALEQDLRAVLDGQPIAARPPGTLELVRRFVGRHRVATLATAAASLVLPAMLVFTTDSLARERASNARTTDALIQSLDIANAMADAMDRQYGASDFLDEYYRRQLDHVAGIMPTVASGVRLADPLLITAVEQFQPPGWELAEQGGRRIARIAGAATAPRTAAVAPELRERYGDALLRFSSVLTASGEDLRSLELRLIGLALEREALARDPRDPERRREHAFAMVVVGDTLNHLGSPELALPLYERALVVDRQLAAEFPEVVRHLDDVAWGLDRIARIMLDVDLRTARTLHRERLAICEELVSRLSPDDDGRAWGHAVHGCASSASSLGWIAEKLGDEDPAPWFRRSEDAYRRVALRYPRDAFYARRSREATTGRMMRLWRQAADADAVLAACDDLVQHSIAVARAAAPWFEPRAATARLHALSAAVAMSHGRWARAEADLDGVVVWATPADGGRADPVAATLAWMHGLAEAEAHADAILADPEGRRLVHRLQSELAGAVARLAEASPTADEDSGIVAGPGGSGGSGGGASAAAEAAERRELMRRARAKLDEVRSWAGVPSPAGVEAAGEAGDLRPDAIRTTAID